MKRKIIASLLAAVMAFAGVLPALAAVPELPESFNEAYVTDFEGYDGVLPDDFYTYFNTYDVKAENVVTEGDNTYYNGMFPSGAYVYSTLKRQSPEIWRKMPINPRWRCTFPLIPLAW